ncbi:penicillin-binding protein 2 [Inquilinus sp. Marseille-Q2685]|uniref:penicillin-binding protein 2 n=1 Tax=Inquilinus sp. Marseille-Q2685 TaxID=2866581 RepID=UPI001CE46A18|nr:penicillin-binding protein 2 [Inquilinus sp. Marseille-Q2685]
MFEDDKVKQKAFTRRALVLAGLQGAAIAGLGAHLYRLQVVERDKYQVLSDKNRIRLRMMPVSRGRLLDRTGAPIAVNTQSFAALVTPENADDLRTALARLATIIPIDSDRIQGVIDKAHRQPGYVPIEILTGLTWEQMAAVSVSLPELPGVAVEQRDQRSYPLGSIIGHLTGYLAEPSKLGDPLQERAAKLGLKVGANGLERSFEERLQGQPGMVQAEVDVRGRTVRLLSQTPGVPGEDVTLAVDAGLQSYVAERLLAERSAAAVVLDIRDGGILAMVSQPGFDPNTLIDGITSAEWAGLSNNTDRPLLNKAISGEYAPGSTFKMVVLLAGLQAGVITPDHAASCRGFIEVGSSRFHCWKRGGHGRVGIRESLKWSCDVFYYDLAIRVGIDRIAEMAKTLGLGTSFDIGLAGERTARIPTAEWKEAAFGQPWRVGETVNAGIGQGYVTTTALQLATMAARLASGRALTPSLIRRGPDAAEPAPLPIDPEFLSLAVGGMTAVVNDRDGTAWSARIPNPAEAMAGKTGTSQVRRITMAERQAGVISNNDLPWERRDHALFVAFSPIHKPRFAAAVVVEHGGGGSAVAAPIARDVLVEAHRLLPDQAEHHHLIAAGPEQPPSTGRG